MTIANRFELHYYLNDNTHQIDAVLHNKSEAELLAIIIEVSKILEVDIKPFLEAYKEGGFRQIWSILGDNSRQISALLLFLTTVFTVMPELDFEKKSLEKELLRLSIEEKKIILGQNKTKATETDQDNLKKIAGRVCGNVKIAKRKSNFYSNLKKDPKISSVAYSALDKENKPLAHENKVSRIDFDKFILKSNKVKEERIPVAEIDIISPVLKEGNHKWKGIFEDELIFFEMSDSSFEDQIFYDNLTFQTDTKLICELIKHREIDEVGDVKIKRYSVPTVIEKKDEKSSYKTAQGKRHLQKIKAAKDQTRLFDGLTTEGSIIE